jgi:uncharacterized membrane protein/predicted DsbA family dithiol-disulfide isomerase
MVAPVFCSEGGGCDALRQTAYAHPLGVPLPVLGIAAFLLLGFLTLTRGARVRRANEIVCTLGGLVGLALLSLQLALHHFCPYCAAVDSAAVLLAVLAVRRRQQEWDLPSGLLPSFASSLVLAGALFAPFAWAVHEEGRVPEAIAEEQARSPGGVVTIVDFVDFECPFCRQMQTSLGPVVAEAGDRVRLVRKLVPLTRIHPHALDAAKAACCGEALGKGDAMADALFETKVDDLTPEGCEKVAASLGLPLDAYRACVASPSTDARLKADRTTFDRATRKGDGLPLMWIGNLKLMGAGDDVSVRQTLVDAIAKGAK